MEYRRNNDVSVFVCRMDIDGRTQKYGNFLRFIRKRLLVWGCKIRSNVLKYVKNGGAIAKMYYILIVIEMFFIILHSCMAIHTYSHRRIYEDGLRDRL